MSKALTESGSFLVLERPDISRLQAESDLTGVSSQLVGVDALVIGSLTEFGRKTVGQSGFVSTLIDNLERRDAPAKKSR